MQNTKDRIDYQQPKNFYTFYRKIRFAGGAKSKSMALTLPKEFLDELDIKVADHVIITKNHNQIIIKKA